MYANGIHVMRNPFDNIATMTLKKANERTKSQEILKVTTMCPVPDTPINRSKHFPLVIYQYPLIWLSLHLTLFEKQVMSQNLSNKNKIILISTSCPTSEKITKCSGCLFKHCSNQNCL